VELVRDSDLLLGGDSKIILEDRKLARGMKMIRSRRELPSTHTAVCQYFITYVADNGRKVISLNKSARDVVDSVGLVSLVIKINIELVLLAVHDD
jgi:hypothetical protein